MPHRQLIAIMFTDLVGFSKLTQRNEALALELLEKHWELLRPVFTGFDGHEIKTIGDAFLIEFPSALQAVRAGLAIQEELAKYNRSAAEDRQIRIRIGIHMGDVERRGDDVFGDGVNIASRIEPLASPGGICISESVYASVHNKVDAPFYPMGEQQLKNISQPVAIFSNRPDQKAIKTKSHKRKLLAATVAAVLIVLFVLVDRGWIQRELSPTVAVRRSIAVLPFVNMSDDPGNEYFSDGMSEEILNLLARIPGLKVIGRTSSFSFKGKNEDLRVIGQTLGVKTVLDGSVRKSGDRVRITAQLVDVSDGAHIWSETYDRTMTDIFAVQDDVAAAIINALQIHVGVVPTRGRPTEYPEAYTMFLKARVLLNAQKGRDASELLLQAVELDPKFAEAYELLAFSYWQQGGGVLDEAEARRLNGEAAAKALVIDPGLAFAQALYHLASYDRSGLSGIEALERAWREQSGNPAPVRPLIYELAARGYLREAHRLAVQLVELDPLSPVANYTLGETLYAIGQTSEAFPPLKFAVGLDNAFAKWFVPAINLAERADDSAIPQIEAYVEQSGLPSNWVRELVIGARDPATGQAYLDYRIPQIVASMPEEQAGEWQRYLKRWYLHLGYLDRYYELIFEAGPNDEMSTDANVLVWEGNLFRRMGFTAHPRYLEVAESLGIVELWEHRGAPDFCEKVDGEWVCQ